MKMSKTIIFSLGVVVVALLYTSCQKTPVKIASTDSDFSNAATVEVFDATVNSARTYVYVDAAPVTGSALAFGSVFPSGAFSFRVMGGYRNFLIKDTLPATTQTPLSFGESFEPGKNYIIFMYDTTNAAKALTVQNDIAIPSDTSGQIKFANFIYNPTDVPAVDLYSTHKGANIFTNITKTVVTPYISYASNLNDTLQVRQTGTTTVLATLNTFFATPKRSYTVIYRGSYRGTKVVSAFAND